jgi:hypothetical protein
MIVGKASNASEATSSKTMGLIESNLSNNGIGNVITEGLLAGLDTTGATNAGDPVWLGVDGNLIYGLTNKPYAPAHLVFIGIVTRINANNGEIFVKVQNGFELREIHDVDLITTTPINGHILGYNGTLWVNKTIAGWLGYTPVTNARTLTINGTSYDLSADRSWTINSMVYPSAGIAVSTGTAWGTSITDNSSNWNTAFGWGNHASAGYVPGARTLTINGTAFDLTANRSWTIDSTSASTRTVQKYTADGSSATYTVTGGYTVGLVDVYVNGIKLDNASGSEFTATNGTTVVLVSTPASGDIVEVYKYGSQFIATNALRQTTLFTATAGQNTFTVNYSVGLVDVFYNGSKLDSSEYTASTGTSIVFNTNCVVGDKVEVVAYTYNATGYTGVAYSGTPTTNYLTKWTSTGTIGNSSIFDNGTNVGIGNTNTTYTLDVTGTARFTSTLLVSGATTLSSTLGIGTTISAQNGGAYAGSVEMAGILRIQGGSGRYFTSGNGLEMTFNSIYSYNRGTSSYNDLSINDSMVIKGGNGNVGIGATLKTWNSSYKALQIGASMSLLQDGSSTSSYWGGNLYVGTDGNYKYTINGAGGLFGIEGGSLVYYGVVSGTANATASLVERFNVATTSAFKIYTPSGTSETLRLTCSDTIGDGYISFYRSTGVRKAFVGYGGSNDDNFYIAQEENAPTIFMTNGTERMRIRNNGSVCINNTDTDEVSLHVHGNNTESGTAQFRNPSKGGNASHLHYGTYGDWYIRPASNSGSVYVKNYVAESDARLKDNIENISYGLNEILNLVPRKFNWKESDKEVNGFIAQEVEGIIPALVSEGQWKSVDYQGVTAILVKAIQEQQAQISAQAIEIDNLKKLIN